MTVSLVWRIQVNDFDSWLNPDPDNVAEMFAGMGVQSYGLLRSADEPNSLTCYFTFENAEAARTFEAGYVNMKADWEAQNPGAGHEIVDSWIGQEVEGYSREL